MNVWEVTKPEMHNVGTRREGTTLGAMQPAVIRNEARGGSEKARAKNIVYNVNIETEAALFG